MADSSVLPGTKLSRLSRKESLQLEPLGIPTLRRSVHLPGILLRGSECSQTWIRGNLVPSLGISNGTPLQYLLLGKSHGQRSLLGCNPWGRSESDTTERLHFHFSLSCIGEGNGNPLQCSCLENPRDGGAWWAAVFGVTQSWTRLK